jgi:hypothetical protein
MRTKECTALKMVLTKKNRRGEQQRKEKDVTKMARALKAQTGNGICLSPIH